MLRGLFLLLLQTLWEGAAPVPEHCSLCPALSPGVGLGPLLDPNGARVCLLFFSWKGKESGTIRAVAVAAPRGAADGMSSDCHQLSGANSCNPCHQRLCGINRTHYGHISSFHSHPGLGLHRVLTGAASLPGLTQGQQLKDVQNHLDLIAGSAGSSNSNHQPPTKGYKQQNLSSFIPQLTCRNVQV